jgi:hypothetical protein
MNLLIFSKHPIPGTFHICQSFNYTRIQQAWSPYALLLRYLLCNGLATSHRGCCWLLPHCHSPCILHTLVPHTQLPDNVHVTLLHQFVDYRYRLVLSTLPNQ